jgi:integrase/recombinase XerD
MKDKDLYKLFDEYIKECTYVARMRPATLTGYKQVFDTFMKIMPEVKKVDDLIPELITEFFTRMQTRTRHLNNGQTRSGMKQSSVVTYRSKLHSFFKWLNTKNILETNPFDMLPKPEWPVHEDQRALDTKEVNQILGAILNNDNDFIICRDTALFYTLLYTGIRKNELINLSLSDIDLLNLSLRVKAETSKSKRERIIPINKVLAHKLTTYLAMRNKFSIKSEKLWVSHQSKQKLTSHGLKHIVAKYVHLSGVKFHLHRFRHTFACQLHLAGASITEIQRLLGHKKVTMTMLYLRSIDTKDATCHINKLTY